MHCVFDDIQQERNSQKLEGKTEAADAAHYDHGELTRFARYLLAMKDLTPDVKPIDDDWAWNNAIRLRRKYTWRRCMVIATALLVAEIESTDFRKGNTEW